MSITNPQGVLEIPQWAGGYQGFVIIMTRRPAHLNTTNILWKSGMSHEGLVKWNSLAN